MKLESSQVLILGAGAAGLAAAGQLARAGVPSIVLEARDRIGGRIHTIHDPHWPMPIELGAEFIHGKPKETLDILGAARRVAYDVTDTHWDCSQDKPTRFRDFWELIDRVMDRVDVHKGPDQTFAQFIAEHSRLNPRAVEHSIAYVEGFDAADTTVAGVEWIRQSNRAEEKVGDELLRPVGGYDGVIDWMHQQLGQLGEVHLNCIVREVRWKRSNVEVETADGRLYRAAALIITLPLGVLKTAASMPGAVRFVPELAEKAEPLSKLHMGGVVKVMLHFSQAFWEKAIDEQMTFLHCTDQDIPIWWSQLPLRAPVLTGWAGGPKAAALARQPKQRILQHALNSLSRATHLSRRKIDSMLEHWQIADWLSDPYSRGAYSYGGVDAAGAARDLAKPIQRTLFFAGEAAHDGMVGTVAGAIASGYRAADEARRALGVPSAKIAHMKSEFNGNIPPLKLS